jgi:hypothetical protein
MINIASYSSYEYLDKILALNNSIKKYENVKFHLFPLDKKIKSFFKKKKEELICYDQKIFKINSNYNFAQKISIERLSFVKYLLFKKKLPNVHLMDSDIYFFSDPNNLKKIVKNSDMAFCYHESNNENTNDRYGNFNAGYLYFNNSINTKNILTRYIDLCKKKVDYSIFNKSEKKIVFADQTYLENLTREFKNILRIKNRTINRGPWNIGKYKIEVKNNQLFLDKKKLVFYHFSSVKKIYKSFYSLGLRMYVKNKSEIKKLIYLKYLKELHYVKKKYEIRSVKVKKKLHFNGNRFKSFFDIIIKKDFLFYY